MGVAYTPGLRVTAEAAVRQRRRLPMRGEVLVRVGDSVNAEDVVARAEMPGDLHNVRAAAMLRVEPQELASHLVRQRGDVVEAGEVIARTQGLWGLFKSEVRSPMAGTLEEVSTTSGHARIRGEARRVEVKAHIAGRVVEVMEGEGAVIEARGAVVQGIFGVGGERRGQVRVIAKGPEERMDPAAVGECGGCVVVAGAGADAAAIRSAAEAGAAALVVGAVRDDALRDYVGYDIGVAITGQEDVPMTLIVTEGFGELPMAKKTWELLRSLEGRLASVDGATRGDADSGWGDPTGDRCAADRGGWERGAGGRRTGGRRAGRGGAGAGYPGAALRGAGKGRCAAGGADGDRD